MASRIAVVGCRHRHYQNDKSVEWIDAEDRAAIRLARRLRNHFVQGVILVQADLTHGISRPILDACRRYEIAYTMCQKSTQTQLKSALRTVTQASERNQI